MRLDQYLVQKKIAGSRTQAQEFISNGFVFIVQNNQKQLVNKSNYTVKETDEIILVPNELQKYVSRAGLKLEFALNYLKLNVEGKNVLDVGQSTGGFTDCLLKRGAKHIVGIDVGHSQLHDSLKKNSQVTSFENLNVKDLSLNSHFLKLNPIERFDLIVVDVSFISLTKVIPSLANFAPLGTEYLFLVKPQFECTRNDLNSNGIVKDVKLYDQVENAIKKVSLENFKNVEQYFACELLGKDGNREFFIYGKKSV